MSTEDDRSCGHLIDRQLVPTDRFLAAIERRLRVDADLDVLRAVRDPRLTDTEWRIGLKREFALLAAWSLRRLATARSQHVRRELRPSRVYSFLPRDAILFHLLRRAVPFAALGIKTLCGAPASVRASLPHSVHLVARLFGLGSTLDVLPVSCRGAVRSLNPTDLLVVTGRRTTMERLQRVCVCPVVGATGRCAIALTNRAPHALYRRLLLNRHRNSCSNVRAAWRFRGRLGPRTFVMGLTTSVRRPIDTVLHRLHPSVILVSGAGRGQGSFICGYRAFTCNRSGASAPAPGFGADPIFGWPGDYMI